MKRRNIVLYGDINLNILDGSAAWLVSLAETLTLTDSLVHVVLKSHVTTDRLLTRISGRDDIVVHLPVTAEGSASMSHPEAVARLEQVTAEVDASVLIVRGRLMSHAASQSEVLSPILWSYITDYTFPATVIQPAELAQLRQIAAGSRRVFMQTQDSRDYFESIVPEAAGRTLLMTPTVPDDFFAPPTPRREGPLRLIYSGKFAPEWRTLEMLSLPDALRNRGIDAELTMLGDKIGPADAGWIKQMDAALAALPAGTRWPGGLPREQAIAAVTEHDIGLSWRSAVLDSSLEISTKMLEYAAAGTPPVLNRTRAHEELFGPDYPLMLDDDRKSTLLAVLAKAPALLDEVRVHAQNAARAYSSSVTAQRLEGYFRRAESDGDNHPLLTERLKVVLAGHDLKFAGELIDTLQRREDIDLRIDHWPALAQHDEAVSQELLNWADVIVCEWAGHNAVWYSHRVRDDQRLVVRLHRFELTAPWIGNIDIDRVDAVVTVSSYYQEVVKRQTSWPPEKIHAIANGIDVLDLDRPKRAGARFVLGMIGIVPILKRPDRTLDLFGELLRHDDRFRLMIRGRMPWEYPWVWKKPLEQGPYLDFFDRIGSSPLLKERVVFSPFGPDIASWLRSVGWVVSPSDIESFHLAPAEGMASGALPIFWPREGVTQIFGDRFLHHSVEEMASFVLEHVGNDDLWRSSEKAAREIVAPFDIDAVSSDWLNLLLPGGSAD